MVAPGLVAILTPVAIGFGGGPVMLGGLLAGVTASGVLMALFQSNAGGAWDNAKKMVEEGYEMGDWTLTINDAFGGDDGNLNSWGVTAAIEPIAAPPYEVDLNADGTVTILMEDLILSVDEACSYTVTSGGDGAGACDFDNPNDGTFENGYNCSSATAFQTANDLDVAAGGDFTLNQITASIFANGGIASVDVIYYDNNAGLPGTEI